MNKSEGTSTPQLTGRDLELGFQFDRQLQLIRDRTKSVLFKHATGVYITGRTGTGKTYAVTSELNQAGAPWFTHNARLTPMGLFELLREHPAHIVVLDDVPSIYKDRSAVQILLAALDGDANMPRHVTYRSQDRDSQFEFAGGLILIGNLPLSRDPMAQALASRVQVLQHDPDDDVLAATIKRLALKAYHGLSPQECWEVAEFVIEETRASDLRLDLRHYFKAVEDFLQEKSEHAETPWRVLVRSSLQKSVPEFLRPPTKQDEIQLQRQYVAELLDSCPDDTDAQLHAFQERFKLGKSTFYDRRRELTARRTLP